MAKDTEMVDADAVEEQKRQYGHGLTGEVELDAKYPNRPKNRHKTLPFHDLLAHLFNPLNDNVKKKGGPAVNRKKQGPHGQTSLSPHEARRNIIERFISKWRKEVGNDFYPALRLIIPEKDRDRAMYGLKEKAIAKMLIRVLKIDSNSEDAKSMLNWKLPGQNWSTNSGDFGGRCYDVLSKRPLRTNVGDMTIGEVNEELDKLSIASKEDYQLPVFERFYRRMNPEELTWLIRMILRQMKIGATEKTILDIWHPDAETLFNVSSNLRRVCWELYDPRVRLDGGDTGITLMQCFQPQLAAFQNHSFEKAVQKMRPTEDDDSFWIEEKLDGERMQLHMMEDASAPGGKRFGFWSRKAKDYTYLYGSSFDSSEENALTRFIRDAFDPGVRNIILDGEMITWDVDLDTIVGFGTLKTAALTEQKNRANANTGQRPLFRVFDCLFLNDTLLTNYTLRDRRKALRRSIHDVRRRIEIHPYKEVTTWNEIQPELEKVIASSSEGLVIKNPRSVYRLNERNDDWSKIKPEYMAEYGESLDCVVVGGYFGSGKRGGAHSSFLCGLLTNKDVPEDSPEAQHCLSFFKVGGGFSKEDYASVRHHTENKWQDWDSKRPPSHVIELGGFSKRLSEYRQYEKPDQWIHPKDSIVVSVKAASVAETDSFRFGKTLRFPRLKQLRTDKHWRSALSVQEFMELNDSATKEHKKKETEFKYEQSRRKKVRTTKKPLIVAGSEIVKAAYAGPETKIFDGLTFFIITDSLKPEKKTKAELEQLVKAHGAKLAQRESDLKGLVLIADKRLVKVSSLEKHGTFNLVRPSWIFDCIKQSEANIGQSNFLLPFESARHMFYLKDEDQDQIDANVDDYGDSYTRDITVEELKDICHSMPSKFETEFNSELFLNQAEEHHLDLGTLPGFMFHRFTIYIDGLTKHPHIDLLMAKNCLRFGGAKIVENLNECSITHIVLGQDKSRLSMLRSQIAKMVKIPRIVSSEWVERCWEEKTVLDEERFGII